MTRIKIAPIYSSDYLEVERPQPLVDLKIEQLIQEALSGNIDKDITDNVYTNFKKETSNFSITISYQPGSPTYMEDFEQFFIKEDIKNVIYTIMKDEHGGVRFDPFEVSIPESYDIKKCYEPEFCPIHEKIVENLNKNESGLYLFHGDPGTGKTTYIKYLSSIIKRDMIYVPTSFVDYISDPAFLPALLHKKHSILIIEDAEKALLTRDPSDSSSIVSTILNIICGFSSTPITFKSILISGFTTIVFNIFTSNNFIPYCGIGNISTNNSSVISSYLKSPCFLTKNLQKPTLFPIIVLFFIILLVLFYFI
jgi:hypothetical protein